MNMNLETIIPVKTTFEKNLGEDRFTQDGNPTTSSTEKTVSSSQSQSQFRLGKEINLKPSESGMTETERKKISDS